MRNMVHFIPICADGRAVQHGDCTSVLEVDSAETKILIV
jgi:hypothetical protein